LPKYERPLLIFSFGILSGAFSDAEVIHVEGDVDPVRDMNIISTELRKDIEWCEKQIENQKKSSRSAGNNSLEDRKKKEDLAIMEKVLNHVGVENKDVRKGEWSTKEVSIDRLLFLDYSFSCKQIALFRMMNKRAIDSRLLTQLFEAHQAT
jgi:ribosome-binding ATPase YchF (GTP1/OBG family)